MTTLGVTADNSSTSTATTAKAVVSKATCTADGIVASGGARVWCSSGTVPVQLGIWADSSGAPGALLGLSDSINVDTTADTERAFTFTGGQQAPVTNAVEYWIGPTWATPGVTMTWSRGAAGTGQVKTVNTQAPNPFGTTTDLNGPVDAYVNHFPAPSTDDGAFFEFF